MLLPRAYDGDEVDLGTWFRAMEALGKLDASTAWCIGQMNGCAATACAVEPAVAREVWGPPRAALSWGPPIKARADEVDGGHRLSGEWMMSSGSRHATWIGLNAPIFDSSGAPVPMPPGSTVCTFLVPADAVTWVDSWDVIGLNATNSGGFKIEDRFVPKGYSAYRERVLDSRIDSPLYKFPLNSFFATGFSGVALGIARTHAGCRRCACGEEAEGGQIRAGGEPPRAVPDRRGRGAPALGAGLCRRRRPTASGRRSWHPGS